MKTTLMGLMLLDCSFRHKSDPLQNTGSTTNVPGPGPVQMQVELIRGDVVNTYAVTLRINLDTPTSQYVGSLAYAALLSLDLEGEAPPENYEQVLMISGATMVFPYCRELVTNLTTRARFGPVWLAPTNFSHLIANTNEPAVANTD
jgi:preprotein translocase subunit SecB